MSAAAGSDAVTKSLGVPALRELTGWFGGIRLVIKDETRSESGSHKQRAAAAVVRAAAAGGHDRVIAGSCGNYGLALAMEAATAGVRAFVVVPEHSGRLGQRLREHGAEVVPVAGGYEDAVATSKEVAQRQGIANGNVDGPYGDAVLAALAGIAAEILDGLPAPPAAVWLPTGNGTTVAALGTGLAAARPAVPGDDPPRLVAVTSRGNNSILASWPGRTHAALDAGAVATTPVRDPLVNWSALHGQQALDILHAHGGRIVGVNDDQLLTAGRILAGHGVSASPSGAAGLAGLLSARADEPGVTGAVHVVVVTGR